MFLFGKEPGGDRVPVYFSLLCVCVCPCVARGVQMSHKPGCCPWCGTWTRGSTASNGNWISILPHISRVTLLFVVVH